MSVAARGQDVLIGGDLAKMLRGPRYCGVLMIFCIVLSWQNTKRNLLLWYLYGIFYCISKTVKDTRYYMLAWWYFALYCENAVRQPATNLVRVPNLYFGIQLYTIQLGDTRPPTPPALSSQGLPCMRIRRRSFLLCKKTTKQKGGWFKYFILEFNTYCIIQLYILSKHIHVVFWLMFWLFLILWCFSSSRLTFCQETSH